MLLLGINAVQTLRCRSNWNYPHHLPLLCAVLFEPHLNNSLYGDPNVSLRSNNHQSVRAYVRYHTHTLALFSILFKSMTHKSAICKLLQWVIHYFVLKLGFYAHLNSSCSTTYHHFFFFLRKSFATICANRLVFCSVKYVKRKNEQHKIYTVFMMISLQLNIYCWLIGVDTEEQKNREKEKQRL